MKNSKLSLFILALVLSLMAVSIVACENTSKNVGLPVAMKIGRTTCVPCRKMSKLLTELEPKLAGKARVEIVDIDEDPDAVKRFDVTGIPVTIFFDVSGNEIYRQIGLLEENEIIGWLEKAGMKK
jgi:thioredoxin 1